MRNLLFSSLFFLAALPVPAAEESPGTIEWVGTNVGGGGFYFPVSDRSMFSGIFTTGPYLLPQTDILLFNLSFRRWHITLLELHPWFFLGFLGGGLRAGATVPLSPDGQQELRIGLAGGGDWILYHINAYHLSLTLKPYIQYIRKSGWGSWGFGADALLAFPFRDEMICGDGHTCSVPPAGFGMSLYLRLTFGRSRL